MSDVVATDDTIVPMLSVGQDAAAHMWVYFAGGANPDNVFDFTLIGDGTDRTISEGLPTGLLGPMLMEDTTALWRSTASLLFCFLPLADGKALIITDRGRGR